LQAVLLCSCALHAGGLRICSEMALNHNSLLLFGCCLNV